MTISLESLGYLTAQRERINPRDELLQSPALRRHYYAFMEQYGIDPEGQDYNVVAHGATEAGEVILATQQGHDFHLATFSLTTHTATEFTHLEKTLIGRDDQTKTYLRAYEHPDRSGRQAELLLTRDEDGNQWRSDFGAPERLRDMRLVTMHLEHLAHDPHAYEKEPPYESVAKAYGHVACTHLVAVS